VSFKGKRVGSLEAGSYRISVTDRSTSSGLVLVEKGHAAKQVTGTRYVGTRSLLFTFAKGGWLLSSRQAGSSGYAIVVNS
jgi:hypothetical protein